MFKKIILGLVLSTLSFTFALTLQDLQKKLNHPVITADFVQTRSLHGMKNPIVSSGNFIVSSKEGLYWDQLVPFKLIMVLTNEKLVQKVENGKPEVLTAKKSPQIFQFNQLLSSLFTINEEEINSYFDVSLSEKNALWTLELHPKKEPINKIFTVIIIKGEQFINEVELYDAQNDVTKIQFKNHKVLDSLTTQIINKFRI